ncbi:Putative phage integrase [Candidatus Phytoplasma australiense]|uniref:Putative phage integrase n=1 Tax=Phytoplasma australiense TaxID=59748 RepID=B1V8S0_PHYAS|nr:Putative phage integrase [Candidatus Phytoplasma australiense]
MSLEMEKKLKLYSLDVKLKAVFAKQEGKRCKEIQQNLKIKNRSQIYQWVEWYELKGAERLEQSIRGKRKVFEKGISPIKTAIKNQLKTSFKKNRKLYLKIINKYQKEVSLEQLIKWLSISKTSYFRWIKQSLHPRPQSELEKALFQICQQGSYITTDGKRKRRLGYRVVHQKLIDLKFKINSKTVLKLMHQFGLLSQRIQRKPQYYYDLAIQKENNLKNLIQNNYHATRPFEKLCTDITYITFGKNNQKLFVSAMMDLYNREIIGYNISKIADVGFVINTLKAIPTLINPCILHCDRASVYTSKRYQTELKANNLITSFSAKAMPTDNACMEAFWANMKRETIHYEKMQNLGEHQIIEIITDYIEYYNIYRKMKGLNYLSPKEFKIKNTN